MHAFLRYLVLSFIATSTATVGVIAVSRAKPEWFGEIEKSQKASLSTSAQSSQEQKISDNATDLPGEALSPETEKITYTTVNNYTTNNTTTNPTTETTIGLSLDDIAKNRVLYVSNDKGLATVDSGSADQVLTSTGASTPPQWVSLGTLTTDWANPGIIGSATPNTATFTALTLTGTTTPLSVGTGSQFQVLDTGRLELSYSGDSGALSSSGGVIFIDNTDNLGTGIGIYSNADGSAQGNMINVKVDNPLYNQAAFYMNYDGLSNAVEIVSNSSDSSSNALAVTGNNINDSTLGIIGYELSKGTIKVTHNRPVGGTDSSASGLSIDLKGSGTRAQGVYVDSTESGGTLGNLLRLRNESIDKFVVDYQGALTQAGNFTQGAYGTDTTFTKYGNTSGDQFFIGTNGAGRFQRSATNSEVFRAQISGDVNGRWVGTSDGRLRWGDGTNATDVTLRRISTARLGVEGALTLNNLNADADTVIKGMNDSNLLYVDASADNIGIGDSTPTFKLDVAGTGRFTGALQLDTLAGGATDTVITHASGVLQQRTIDSRVWGSSLVDGSGSGSYVARWSDANTLTTGALYDDGTNVGIGTTTNLTAKLVINGTVRTTSEGDIFSQYDGGSATTYPVFARYWDNNGTYTSGTYIFANGTNGYVGIEKPGGSSVSRFQVKSDLSTFTSNVGIGTTSTSALLHVYGGDVLLENNQSFRIKDSGGSARPVLAYTSGNNVQLYDYASSGIVQIGLNNASNTAGNIRFFTNANTERMRIDPAGVGIGATSFGTSAANVLAIANSTVPTTSITDGIQLFAVDQGGLGHELRVRDEAGNVTTLSPHNFTALPDGISEPMAWSFYSERDGKAVSVDMTKAMRLVEDLSGQQLVYVKDLKTGEYIDKKPIGEALTASSDTLIDKSYQEFMADAAKNFVSVESLKALVGWDGGVWQFLSEVVFNAKVKFLASVEFLSDVKFVGHVGVGKDTAGTVVIPVGATAVTVEFEKAYGKTPLVYLTPRGEGLSGYGVKDVSERGFTIQLAQSADKETSFNWLAVVGNGGGAKASIYYPASQSEPAPTVVPKSAIEATPEPMSTENTGEVAGAATGAAEILDTDLPNQIMESTISAQIH